jgi:colanic acid/amylovoran biosynthesis glycosyltransferase
MNKKELILITTMFPFGKKETYLEAEIPILSHEFDKITIVCPRSKEPQRKLPENVSVVHSETDESFNLLQAIGCFFSIVFIQEIFKICSKAKIGNYFNFFKIAYKDFYRSSKFMRWIKQQDFDKNALYYNYWTDYRTLSLARLKKESSIKKFISRFHRWDLYFEANEIPYLPFRGFIANEADLLVFISEHGLQYIKSHPWVNSNKDNLYLARLGTTLSAEEKKNEINPNGVLSIVSVSSVIPRKRVELIKDTVMKIDIPVIWYHFGDKKDSKMFDNLSPEDQKKIKWMGIFSNEKLHEWYAANQVGLFVNLSLSEGVPVSIMEAMSYGIPALACGVDGIPEIIKHEFNGFLVEQYCKEQDVAKLISEFITLPEDKKKEFRLNAYNTWNEYYNAEKNFKKFALTIKDL